MEFTQSFYPVDKAIFDRLIEKRGLTKQEMGIAMGYSKSAIGEAVRQGRASRKIAAALFANYGITPNDYAPKVPGVNAPAKAPDIGVMLFDAAGRELRLDGTPVPKPRINPVDEALLPDGVYTLEFVDVRPGRRTGDQAEGYRFVTIATGNERRMPYYFSLYNRDYGGKTENGVGAEWILHLLRVALGADWHDGCAVNEIVGRKVRAYVMIYEKAGKRYNRTVWVEPVEMMPEPAPAVSWQDVLNVQTDSETLWAALEYIVGELHLRSHKD